MGREVLASDLDVDLDLSDPTTRQLFARRLAVEIAGHQWTTDPETASPNQPTLSRSMAVEKMARLLRDMHEGDQAAGSYKLRGVIKMQDTYEAIAGQSFEEALASAVEEYEEHNIEQIGAWFID